jgi:hypothetical protein
MTTLLSAFFLALVTERVMAALLAPIRKRWPDLDLWWALYPTWLVGGVLAYFANINLFTDLVPGFNPEFGRILTAVVAGGGANLLHDIFDRPPTTSITTTSAAPGLMTATVRTDEPMDKE